MNASSEPRLRGGWSVPVPVARGGFAVYAACLFTATHWPALRVEAGNISRLDLWVHMGAFGAWAVLFAACGWFGARWTRRNMLLSSAAALVYAAVDEGLQAVPWLKRSAGIDDLAANWMGVGIATLGMFAAVRFARGRRAATVSRDGDADGDSDGLGRGVRTVGGLTLVSRVLGLMRDVATARMFGDTALGSSFAAALMIPNIFRRLFGEGAISAAFIPAYTKLLKSEGPAADALASLTIGAVAAVTGALTIAGELGLWWLVSSIDGDTERARSFRLMMLTLPYMPLICVSAILGGVLQVRGKFGPWAAAPIILNLCMIGSAAPFFISQDADAGRWAALVCGSVVLSGVIQTAWSLLALRGLVSWTSKWGAAASEARGMLTRLVPALVGLGTLQLNTLADTVLAMWPTWVGPTVLGRPFPLDEASNSVLFYAQRLYQFPLGVFGIAVATVAFPLLSKHADDPDCFREGLRRGLCLSLFIALPASAGLMLVGGDLTRVILGGMGPGFSAEGVTRAAAVLLGYGSAVWAYSLNQVLVRGFYARGDTATPMHVALGAVVINVAGNLALIWPLGEAGLAWSTAVSAVAQTLALAWLLRSKVGAGPLLDSAAWRSMARTTGLTVCMTLAIAGVLLTGLGDGAWPIGRLAGLVALGGAVHLGLAAFTRAPELRWLLSRRSAA